ncbi:MAG: hypothetical protein WCY11_05345 [Novosphingobium sp.]
MTDKALPTRNEAWGFYGATAGFTDADAAWAFAFPAVAEVTAASAEAVREFLDSRHGRHFADDVHNAIHDGLDLDAAIHAAIARWMGWTIDRNTARETGIPKGLPYLTGFVTHFAIEAELAD